MPQSTAVGIFSVSSLTARNSGTTAVGLDIDRLRLIKRQTPPPQSPLRPASLSPHRGSPRRSPTFEPSEDGAILCILLQCAVFQDLFPEKKRVRGNPVCNLARVADQAILFTRTFMLPVELRIHRAQRLLRMIEQDAPLLAVRVAPLSLECQQSAKSHVQRLAALTRAELRRLMKEKAVTESSDLIPQAAD